MPEGPEKFDRYEVLGTIGRGGMGEVLKARAVGPHGFEKVVALKRMLPITAQDHDYVRRFVEEARLVARLHHANIVQVYDFGSHDDELFLVMELVEGLSLHRLLAALAARDERLPVAQVIHIGLEVARALAHAHGYKVPAERIDGIVHCDVTPSNVLLSRAGEVKLTDFGVARALVHGRPTNEIAGTQRYMSPEQRTGLPLDGRTDLYSLGVVLHEAMLGEPPPDVPTRPLRPSGGADDGAPRLEGALGDVVARLLREDRAERYGSASELASELLKVSYDGRHVLDPHELGRRVAEHAPAALDPPMADGAVPQVLEVQASEHGTRFVPRRLDSGRETRAHRRTSRRTPPAAFGAALALGLAGALGAAFYLQASRPPQATGAAEPRPQRPDASTASSVVEAAGEDAGSGLAVVAPPPGAHTPDSGKAPARTETTERIKSPPPRLPPPPPAPPPPPGFLDVYCEPWAEVWVDGTKLDKHAPLRAHALAPGVHAVKCHNPVLNRTLEERVEIRSGATALLSVKLTP